MIPLIEGNREAIVDLCRHYGVQKLALFGSAARGDFDPKRSDVDFVFEFLDYGPGVGRRFMRFAVELEDLLEKRVDLVFESVISDAEFLDDVRSTQEVLYEAEESAEAPVRHARNSSSSRPESRLTTINPTGACNSSLSVCWKSSARP